LAQAILAPATNKSLNFCLALALGMAEREHLLIGNTAKGTEAKTKDGAQRYAWSFYVRGATRHIDNVIVKLHPTFKDPVRTLHGPDFEFKTVGWGTFELDVTVNWKAGSSKKYVWELQFDKPDAHKEVEVPPEISTSLVDKYAAAAKPAPKPKAKQMPMAKKAMVSRRLSREPSEPQKYFVDEESPEDKLVGVVVTLYEGKSYDQAFREVRPSTVPGERISTYSMACRDVAQLRVYLEGSVPVPRDQPIWRSLVDDVNQVEADSVTFNWECCSSCGDNCFPCSRGQGPCQEPALAEPEVEPDREGSHAEPASPTMQFMAFALRKGFTVMCSDFSLKSLIHEWSAEHLGPNPFVKLGTCADQFQLEFVPTDLQHEDVPQQLQVVGQLCSDQGKAVVEAMGDTILYSVDPNRSETRLYSLKVLTVVTDYARPSFQSGDAPAEVVKCTVGRGMLGLAGHVALTYSASGGQLITSMGHWSELSRIDTSLESVLKVAGHEFGEEEVISMRAEYASKSTAAERAACVQERAKKMVQMSAPSKMKSKTKY